MSENNSRDHESVLPRSLVRSSTDLPNVPMNIPLKDGETPEQFAKRSGDELIRRLWAALERGRVVSGVEMDRELTRALPTGFVDAYLGLHLRALIGTQRRRNDVGVARGRAVRGRTSTGQTETRGGAHNHKRAGVETRDVLHDEVALRDKAVIDRRLRKLARSIRVMTREDGARASVRRCTRCRQYAEDTWSFCPYDGAPTEER